MDSNVKAAHDVITQLTSSTDVRWGAGPTDRALKALTDWSVAMDAANYLAQITALQARATTLEVSVTALTARVAVLEKKVK